MALKNRVVARARARGFPAKPVRGRALSGKPARGTRVVSIPEVEPINSTWAPIERRLEATHSAGIACPPVPPPAIRTRGGLAAGPPLGSGFDLSGSLTVLRYSVEHPDGGEAYQEA